MSMPKLLRVARRLVLAAPLGLALCGCTYDYLQHTDRIAYSAGDAVKANLEAETINPSKASMWVTTGLGKNGDVMPTTAVVVPASPAAP